METFFLGFVESIETISVQSPINVASIDTLRYFVLEMKSNVLNILFVARSPIHVFCVCFHHLDIDRGLYQNCHVLVL